MILKFHFIRYSSGLVFCSVCNITYSNQSSCNTVLYLGVWPEIPATILTSWYFFNLLNFGPLFVTQLYSPLDTVSNYRISRVRILLRQIVFSEIYGAKSNRDLTYFPLSNRIQGLHTAWFCCQYSTRSSPYSEDNTT